MRTETKIGVVAGFAVVVAASVYFWKSKARDRDLIVALTPSVTQPLNAGGTARSGLSPAPQEAAPTRIAAAPTMSEVKPPPPVVLKPEPISPVVSAAAANPADSAATPEKLAASPQFAASNAKPTAPVPVKATPMLPPRLAVGGGEPSMIKPQPSESAGASVENSAAKVAAPGATRIADSTSSGTVKLPPAIAQPPEPAVKPAAGSEWKTTGAAPATGEWPKYHTVAKGETLAGIARKTYGDARRVDLILAANPEIKSPRQVRVGAKLTLPSAPDATKTEFGAKPKEESSTEVAAARAVESKPISLLARANSAPVDAKQDAAAASPLPSGKTYTVQQGDSLYSIAVETLGDGRRWPELMKANKAVVGADGSKIRPGMVLTIPGDAAKPGSEQSAKR